MSGFDRSILTLEFDKVREMLCACAMTEGAKELARTLEPETRIDRIRKLLKQTSDAKSVSAAKGAPSFSAVRDVRDALERAEKGASLSARELLDIAGLLRCARTLCDYASGPNTNVGCLSEIFARLVVDRKAEERISKAIISEDEIADEASPELSDIRRKIRVANNKVRDSLQSFITGARSKYLQENIITSRNGRFVIPVKVEYKNEIKGLVHDTSSSGATLFIEPISVVEANNEIRVLTANEQKEIERILANLSAMCAGISDMLALNFDNINLLAFIFAKSELSYKLNAVEPEINEKRNINLIKARHPLIDKDKIVPINVMLGDGFDTLVITGPNTGGKTVTLKTLGLFSLMAQSGLHLPCSEGSCVCVFDRIFADIGDEQSIEQSLSTFSSHMVNIVGITRDVTSTSLVLFDELGAGTDPVEGAALAVSILEHIRERGALCAATTHYAELKMYALENDGVRNASCEFDVDTLRPTYRLIIGAPGRSNAFAISSKLGISDSIIERASMLVSNENKHFEDIIGKLEESRLEMDKNRVEAEKMRAEYELFKSEKEAEIKARLDEAEKQLSKAQTQAAGIIRSARASSDYILEQLEEVKRHRESEKLAEKLESARADIRRKLRQAGNEADPVIERKLEGYVLPRPLKIGDKVHLVDINKSATVTDISDRDGKLTVKAGILTMRTHVSNVMLEEDDGKGGKDAKKAKAYAKYHTAVRSDFTDELDIRGQLGDDGCFMIDKYFDEAKIAGIRTVRIIHGKGTGALRSAVWAYLKKDTRVKEFRLGRYGEGDMGVTVVELK
ncbi:MAG: endonuclease MutS2 [Clostridia bacterium]|nr:endonuclease MutS2 [Clostridia bacterium]